MAGELKRSNSTFNISASPKLFTLAIVNTGGRVLLGLKKRGFGEGYFNGFGGKLEEGESIDEAAARELEEEACISPVGMKKHGVLMFFFDDRPCPWEVHVFNVPDYMGKPCETEEMLPTWFAHEDIPYDLLLDWSVENTILTLVFQLVFIMYDCIDGTVHSSTNLGKKRLTLSRVVNNHKGPQILIGMVKIPGAEERDSLPRSARWDAIVESNP
ncbi:hypothetical protein AMTR_s00039p00189990 [Amborella trichopoda]|uniref:Oxidized purine nucleoside triphosphate hydrolase n=1 Tax=Amborella trichopoda TaxID=13333 RepID=U5D369_AMBTC|nr:hypothetical protein AMTR_s00039p00189990 [Amborella trichopoda]